MHWVPQLQAVLRACKPCQGRVDSPTPKWHVVHYVQWCFSLCGLRRYAMSLALVLSMADMVPTPAAVVPSSSLLVQVLAVYIYMV